MFKREAGWQEFRRECARFAGGHKRGRQHPQRRRQCHDGNDNREGDEQYFADIFYHAPPRFCNLDWSSDPSRMMKKRTNAIAAEYPKFHQRNPCWYMSRTMLSVLLTGPPWVMTYGSVKSWKLPIMAMMLTNTVVGASMGSVILLNCCQKFAPSIRAASYNSLEMFCKPATKMIML